MYCNLVLNSRRMFQFTDKFSAWFWRFSLISTPTPESDSWILVLPTLTPDSDSRVPVFSNPIPSFFLLFLIPSSASDSVSLIV